LAPFFPDPVFSQKLRELCVKVQEVVQTAKPDIIVSYFLGDHYLTVNAVGHEYPLILMHHFDPSSYFLDQAQRELQSLQYCDCLQLLLPSYEKPIRAALPRLKNIQIIPNIVPSVECPKNDSYHSVKTENLITMFGRLDRKQKQQHFLIRSFAYLAKEYPQWKVHFYGGYFTSHYEEHLKDLIRQFNLENQVFLKGTTNKPFEILQDSDIFAFPTAFEGFPLALTEAMSVGLPCVGLKTTPAVNELIIDGYNGFLSENNEADFAQKLKRLMDDPALRATQGQNGREFVKQFEPKKIWDQWENLIVETVQKFRHDRSERLKVA
jgi:glycosyltransferase involved in cell wall biosynthesis